jgi:type I restriction enzyme, R subunit
MQFTEDTLEKAIIEQFESLDYEYLYGPDVERDHSEVILKDYFFEYVTRINKGITQDILEEAYKQVKNLGLIKLAEINEAFHKLLVEGVLIPYKKNDEAKTFQVKLIDFENIQVNDFKVVNQYTIKEFKTKRPDIIIYVNGIPLVVFELKNAMKDDTTIENAYNQIKNYQLDIPSLFHYNAFNVISDGVTASMGTISADFTRYMVWKSRDGEASKGDFNPIDVLLEGVFRKDRLLDIIRNFIVFQDVKGNTVKIVAGYHQYFAVTKAVNRTKEALANKDKKVGVIWHTQGSGKSFSMVFYTGLLVTDPKLNNPTVVVLTDRNDLDNQLYSTFAACSKLLLRQEPKQAKDREHLKELLRVNAGGIIFTTIQKFDENPDVLSERSNIIFIADEAHRSQYGLEAKFDRTTGEWKYGYAKNMRDALPNATFIGFTGTPIDFNDKSTREIFGDYIDIYDMTQAVEDGATVPIYYENRTARLKLDEEVLKQIDTEYSKIAEETTQYVIDKSKQDLSKIETIIGSKQRLEMLASDIIKHYEERQYVLTGKAMIVCMSRKIAINLYKEILNLRPDWTHKVKVVLTENNQDDEAWHDIIGNKDYRKNLAIEFKDEKSEMKIAIVVDMWLTGFDVPSMATMYIDKPMKGHSLMQAIARVNRVYKDKEAGLVVDYIGMAAELKSALNEYTNRDKDKVPDVSKALSIALEKLEIMKDFFYGFDYNAFFGDSEKGRLDILLKGINYVLGFDEEDSKLFIREATALSQAETLCRALLNEEQKKEIEYFKGVKAGVCKVANRGKLTANEVNARIEVIIEQAIQQEGVFNIFAATNQANPEISILSEEYMNSIKNMKHKNIAAELLRKLLNGNIRVFQRSNVVKSELFSKKLKDLMKKYNNRMITSAEVIEELLNLSKDIVTAVKEGEEKGLSTEEYAFYEALVADPKVLEEMQDATLIAMAHELTDMVRKNKTIDWDKKESARAAMRRLVKRLLRKYKYPPERADGAVNIVIKQAELMSAAV